jgi:hypothetical protein
VVLARLTATALQVPQTVGAASSAATTVLPASAATMAPQDSAPVASVLLVPVAQMAHVSSGRAPAGRAASVLTALLAPVVPAAPVVRVSSGRGRAAPAGSVLVALAASDRAVRVAPAVRVSSDRDRVGRDSALVPPGRMMAISRGMASAKSGR